MKFSIVAAGLALAVSGAVMAQDTTIKVDIGGTFSWEFQGDPLNEHINVGLQVGDVINNIRYDFLLTTFSPSWADEPRIGIGDGAAGNVAILGNFGSSTTVALLPVSGAITGISHVMVGDRLDLEFYETDFNDFVGAPDALYEKGSIWIDYTKVPAPGILALMGVAGLVSHRRRRKA